MGLLNHKAAFVLPCGRVDDLRDGYSVKRVKKLSDTRT